MRPCFPPIQPHHRPSTPEDQRYHAEHVEVERHVVAGGPSDKHHDRNHTQRNLRVFHAGRRQQACRCGWADKRVDVDMHTRT
eukprot:349875-Chlamydomonas_euryale.AAC.1